MRSTTGLAQLTKNGPLEPLSFDRRGLAADDVAITVTYCGVCHSDIHAMGATDSEHLPLVPGHEFVGEVAAVGEAVTKFRVGDSVAVGNIIDSCGTCASCLAQEESYCEQYPVATYGGRDKHDGSITKGGFSHEYVAGDRFVYHLPAELDPASAAPLMCAGITTWSPLERYGVGPDSRVGIVGLGGLGHLAVKLAKARGAHVTVFTTSPDKTQAALDLGADNVLVSIDSQAMAEAAKTFDFILDTASVDHDPSPYLRTLDMDGTMCMLGIPPRYSVDSMSLLLGRRKLTASGSGGTRDTQMMLDFCAEHGITADVEVLPFTEANTALNRLAANDVRYRFVLDMTSS